MRVILSPGQYCPRTQVKVTAETTDPQWPQSGIVGPCVRARIAAKSITMPVPSQDGQLSRCIPRLHEHRTPVFG